MFRGMNTATVIHSPTPALLVPNNPSGVLQETTTPPEVEEEEREEATASTTLPCLRFLMTLTRLAKLGV